MLVLSELLPVTDTGRPSIGRSDDEVRSKLDEINRAIEELGRGDVTVIAVTKGFDRSAIDCAARLGIADIGENYAQELAEKTPLPDTARAHFIGRIQRNKVRKIADVVRLWHSVSRPEVLVELAKRSESPRALIQLAAAGDPSKDGVEVGQLESMLEVASAQGVAIDGLMTIGVFGDAERTRQSFFEMARIADQFELRERSMGMSGDYRDALEAGATMLRLGSVLFGPRPASDTVEAT